MGASRFLESIPLVCPICEGELQASQLVSDMGTVGAFVECTDCRRWSKTVYNENAVEWGVVKRK